MIEEGVADALLRRENRRLLEASEPGGGLYEVDAAELIDFGRAYVALGAAVREQLEELLDSQEDASVNPNAFDVIEQGLRGANREIDAALDAWAAANVDDSL